MAKNSDRSFSSVKNRLLKYRQAYDLAQAESEALEEKYEEIKIKKLNKFTAQSNKKLLGVAFEACDKAEYAQKTAEEKIQKFDAKQYLAYREANHTASKAIFHAVKAGQGWEQAIKEMKDKIASLQREREEFVKKVEQQKAKYLATQPKTDGARYQAQLNAVQEERTALAKSLDQKLSAQKEAERQRLKARMTSLEQKIALEKSKLPQGERLGDDTILSVRGLKMYFGGLRAVDDLTFDVKKGEIFGLIGPNGAGKTTVFNCITQFYKPTAGQLLFVNKEGETVSLTDYKVHDVILQGIARTFQNVEVVKEVTVLENLLIAATRNYTSNLLVQTLHLPKLKREEKLIRAKADKVLKYMDLFAYRDRLCWGLPYGVLKRVEIARALMSNPQLVILDEPAAGLNESETAELAELINKIRKDFDCTILLVEHDMSLVMSVCDHICAISFGKKLAYGVPAEVQASKEVQEAYLGVGGEE